MPARHEVKLVLRHGIVSGVIPAGTRLVQSVIADQLAVSTRQVRDALRDLAAQGFVRIDARGSAVVHELCRSDLEDIYQVRMLLEPAAAAAARGASLASEDTVLRAAALLAAMGAETDAQRWAGLDSGFHRVTGEPGSSPRLAALLENLRELSAGYVRHSVLVALDRARASGAEHEEIMRALLKGDPEAAADATFRHLDGTLSALHACQARHRERSLAG
jgi:DNA-binding GntR family transcriptional regulator